MTSPNDPHSPSPSDRPVSPGTRLRALERQLPDAMARDRHRAGEAIGHIRYQMRKRRRVKRLSEQLDALERRLVHSAAISPAAPGRGAPLGAPRGAAHHGLQGGHRRRDCRTSGGHCGR